MRIYLSATMADLARPEGLTPRIAHTRTPELVAALGEQDVEAGEWAALIAAGQDAARLLTTQPNTGAHPTVRRIVVAADVPDVRPAPDEAAPSAVSAPEVPWNLVVSLHVDDDDPATQQVLTQSVAALDSDEAAAQAIADLDLLWFDVTERELVLSLP